MTPDQLFAWMASDQDQDIENAKQWIRESDPLSVIDLAIALGKTHPNPMTEVVTRFAMIGLTVVVQSMADAEKTE
jgi:hypothetical protein